MGTIKDLRERKGLTQEELGKEVGVSKTSISHIETGRTRPRPTTVRKLAGALGIGVEELVVRLRTEREEQS